MCHVYVGDVSTCCAPAPLDVALSLYENFSVLNVFFQECFMNYEYVKYVLSKQIQKKKCIPIFYGYLLFAIMLCVF
jgi:hypothetical protein